MPSVVIIGCGFGGLAASRALARADVEVTLLDRSNHHLFQPLLYQVATAGLSAQAIAEPIRHLFAKQRNLTTLMASVRAIDVDRRQVALDDGATISYDYLIVAAGARHSYFGRDEWETFAPGLKTLQDALEIRQRILMAFERAERERDAAKRDAWLTFVVVGAGATGVEMAGALTEIACHTLRGEFRRMDPGKARVVLIEGTERVLPPYPAKLSVQAEMQLRGLGVEVRTASRVTQVDADGVELSTADGTERISAKTVVWSAGVAASALGKFLHAPLDQAGRVRVEPDLSLPEFPEVFVVGDMAAISSDGKPVPGVAPAARQMGRLAADNVLRRIDGRKTKDFHYRDYGSLATIGRKAAVALVGKLQFSGYPAWLFWLFVHILFLIGFRNRLMVLTDWAWSYVTYARNARVVIDPQGEASRED